MTATNDFQVGQIGAKGARDDLIDPRVEIDLRALERTGSDRPGTSITSAVTILPPGRDGEVLVEPGPVGVQDEVDPVVVDSVDPAPTPVVYPIPRPRWSDRMLGRALVVVDLSALVVAVAVVGSFARGFAALGLTIMVLNAAGRLYAPRLSLSVLEVLPPLLGRALVAGAVVTSMRLVAGEGVGLRLLNTGLLFAAVALLARAVLFAAVRGMRRRGLLAHRTLVIGAGRVGGRVAETLLAHREYGLKPVGFLDDDPLLTDAECPLPVLGDTSRLSAVLAEQEISNVVVAFGTARESQVVDIIRTCDRLTCEIFFVPRLFELHSVGHDTENVRSVPLVRIRRSPFRTWTWRLKRVFDVVASGLALLLLAPVLAVSALAVLVASGRPLLFRQVRVGLDGREFTLLKFRSMTPVVEGAGDVTWDISQDDRLGRVGRFLRKTSLDELPQLWNILRGDMSLVGPRPERPHFVAEFSDRFPRYMARHRVPAGLTGWAQVNGLRGDTSIEDRVSFDNYYIENWSLWEDTKILLRTVGQVARAGGG
jgi:exopolysaccharide biosynthesis polyprenyl glycosylphosphotransferase